MTANACDTGMSGGYRSTLETKIRRVGRMLVATTGFVTYPTEGYPAAGSGESVAIGAMWLAARHRLCAPDAVGLAIEAAFAHAPGCFGRAVVKVCT